MVIHDVYLASLPMMYPKSLAESRSNYDQRKAAYLTNAKPWFAMFNTKDYYVFVTAPGVTAQWNFFKKLIKPEAIVYESPMTHNINYADATRLQMFVLHFGKTGVPNYEV